ncbi:hypothetical protein Tco_0723849 [Tanacetum coccineum]
MVRLVTHTIADEIKEHSGKKKRKVAFGDVPPPVKKTKMDGVVIYEHVATTVGKSPDIIQKLISQSGQPAAGLGSAIPTAEEFVSSSVTPTLEYDCQDESVSTHDDNIRTRVESDSFVILTSSSESLGTDILTSPQVVPPISYIQANSNVMAIGPVNETGDSSVPRTETGTSSSTLDRISLADDFYDSQTIDSATAHDIYISNWNASLCNRHDSNFHDLLNVNYALHACMVSELRLRYKHETTVRQNFEQKFLKSFEAVQQRDAEIVVLKTKLEKAESEAADAVKLCRRVSELEATAATKAEELAGLSSQNAELSGQVSGLESVCDGLKGKVVELESECERLWGQVEGEAKLKEQFVAIQDVEVQRLADRGSALDARLSELSYQVDSELYPHMLTAVGGRRWVIGHGLRLAFMKCFQSLDYQTALGKVISLAIDRGIQ